MNIITIPASNIGTNKIPINNQPFVYENVPAGKNINKQTLIEAVNFGNKVSSISVQRKGAQPSIPYLKEIEEIYGEN